jgi:hypothetical protein
LITAGEVHLERCVRDLHERYARGVHGFTVSEPIVPFMETVVARARVDRVNERVELVADVDADVVGGREAGGIQIPDRTIDAQSSMYVTHARYSITGRRTYIAAN